MNRDEWFRYKWPWVTRLTAIAAVGGITVIVGLLAKAEALAGIGLLAVIPLLLCIVVLSALHWKDRYVGHNSSLWGALLVLETSGWFKLVYWFRHILADKNGTGRYRDVP